jgi:hypothetical protein
MNPATTVESCAGHVRADSTAGPTGGASASADRWPRRAARAGGGHARRRPGRTGGGTNDGRTGQATLGQDTEDGSMRAAPDARGRRTRASLAGHMRPVAATTSRFTVHWSCTEKERLRTLVERNELPLKEVLS